MELKSIKHPVLFALGFRPFFGLAGLAALVLMVVWQAIYKQGDSGSYYPTVYWHAHEMLIGYTTAVIAGFLLTAVKNWTGLPTPSGKQLATMCLLWLYGRILPFYAGVVPATVIALTDLAFLPFLIVWLIKPIVKAKQNLNLIFPGLLSILFLGNILVHAELLNITEQTARIGLHLMISTIVIMILIIAGRILPFFTERGLPGTVCIRNIRIDQGAVLSALLVFTLSGFGASGTVLAITAFITVILNIARLYTWYTLKIWYVPLLWVLYAGYGWIILGFVLTIFSAYGWVASSLPLHAFTVGGVGVLTLGMMTRVSLGHTGRKLKASTSMAIAFGVINAAALIRVIFPILLPVDYRVLMELAMLAWLAAFLFFIFEFSTVLTEPRVDGKEG